MLIRTCKKCGLDKDITLFVKNKKCKDGYVYCCKECKSAYQNEWGKANIKKLRAYRNAYHNAYHNAYRKANTEKVNAYRRAWRKANIEKVKAMEEANKENIKAHNRGYTNDLVDRYIVALLSNSGIKTPTPEMIEEKRLSLKIKRKIKQIQTQLK